jgi:ketosteroid isomerase-like protein
MRWTRRERVICCGLLVATACQQQAPVPAGLSDADKAAIAATVDSALRIANTAPFDAAAYVRAYYAEDAIVMAPNEKALRGHAAIEPWFKALPPLSDVAFATEEISGSPDIAYLRGRYTFTVTPTGVAAMVDSGKFLEIWKRRPDGSWRNAIDAFNSDLPLPSAGAPGK